MSYQRKFLQSGDNRLKSGAWRGWLGMKIALGILIISLGLIGYNIVNGIRGHYRYQREVYSNWTLADKASTISQKSEYVDKFVGALGQANFDGEYNAVLFPTPDNSFDLNLKALRSLQSRLRQIQTMKPDSFEYQAAMQQITAQEQGEAHEMLAVFEGVWWKRNYFLLWDWICFVNWLIAISLLFVAFMVAARYSD